MSLIRIRVLDSVWSERVIIVTDSGRLWYPKCSIRSVVSRNPISWYHHDLFRKITYVYWDNESGSQSPKFYLEDTKLYSIRKLRRLASSENFVNKKYAFFFYGEVYRLLGVTSTEEGMSGLFA